MQWLITCFIFQLQYEYYNDCRYLLIGETFGQQPYAVAIQQGSHLSREIGDAILNLQKEKFFEIQQAKYWNNSIRKECPILDDSEGV